MNRTDYISKMNELLSDQTKFIKTDNISQFKQCLRNEDKINRLLIILLTNNIITQSRYNDLYSSGSSPRIMYGLSKIHEKNTPPQPILAAYNTPTYPLAKFLISILQPLSQ
jgi:hypothetical protein